MPFDLALINAYGSHGDVLPLVALGRALRARGLAVVLQTNPFFADHVAGAGLDLLPLGERADYDRFFAQPVEGDPKRAMAQVAAELMRLLPPAHAALRARVRPGRTVAIGGGLGMVHRLLAETAGLPCATVHLAPSVLRSNLAPPRLVPEADHWRRWHSPRLNRFAWWLMDRAYNDRHFTRPLNAVRAGLGLAPVADALGPWLHQADVLLGLFPAWFAPPPGDWPPALQLPGFPMPDGGGGQPLPAAVEDFLRRGPPPVVFAPGTANGAAQDFFAASVQACRQAGLRGLFVTHFRDQLPQPLPPDQLHADYLPFGALLPRAAALVHHGGIGTVAQALRAGVPQLLRPVAYDQFDNAERVQRLGAGTVLLPAQYRVDTVARALRGLVDDPVLRARCGALAGHWPSAADPAADPVALAAQAVLAAGSGPAAGTR